MATHIDKIKKLKASLATIEAKLEKLIEEHSAYSSDKLLNSGRSQLLKTRRQRHRKNRRLYWTFDQLKEFIISKRWNCETQRDFYDHLRQLQCSKCEEDREQYRHIPHHPFRSSVYGHIENGWKLLLGSSYRGKKNAHGHFEDYYGPMEQARKRAVELGGWLTKKEYHYRLRNPLNEKERELVKLVPYHPSRYGKAFLEKGGWSWWSEPMVDS